MENPRPHYDIYLSYTGRKSYLKCPEKYRYQYIENLPSKSDVKDAGFGTAIGKLFEWFYNRRIWASPNFQSDLESLIVPAVQNAFLKHDEDPKFRPDVYDKIISEVREYSLDSLKAIQEHSLLTESSRSEVDLTVYHTINGLTVKIGGRADFLHGVGGSSWIVDGKGSQHREKYVDSEQLVWYSVQHYLKFKVVPTRLGFLYYRSPTDPVQWISYGADDLRKSVSTTFDVAKKILLKQFPATPSTECGNCNYQSKCEVGRKFVAARRVSDGGRIQNSIFDVDPI